MADTASLIAGGNANLTPDSVSVPGVHPSWSAEDTLKYWQTKNNNTQDLINAIKSGVTSGNYLDIMNSRAKDGDVDAIQWLTNYYATQDSEKTAREWTAQREDTAYQRLVSDLEKAGISPYVLSGATPAVSSSSGHSYSGTELTSGKNNKLTTETSSKNTQMQSILRALGVIAVALIYAAK